MSAVLRVEVLLFAGLRELCGGRGSIPLELPAGADAEACFECLCADYPSLATRRGSLALAVNEEYASWATPLSDGDVVSFIPPVSGG